MASTYSQLGIEKPADGEQSGTWGQTVNTNSEIIEQAIGGYAAVTTTAGGTVSVSITDGALSDGRAHFLKLTGSPAGSYTLELPEVEKAWTIWNASGQTATIQTASATTTVSLANGGIVEVVSDGAGTVEACTKPLATDGTLLSDLPIAEGGTGSSTASAARMALGLQIGSDIQAFAALLSDIAGLSLSQGDVIYYDGSNLTNLGPGTDGHFLQTQGAGSDPQWAGAARIATGSYVGDGSTSNSITGVGFQPKHLTVWLSSSDGGSPPIFITNDSYISADPQGLAVAITAGGGNNALDNRILSLDADGFTVSDDGTDSAPNANGAVYRYTAWG